MNCVMTDADLFRSTLALTAEQIKASSWTGTGVGPLGAVIADICESAANSGYYSCRVIGRGGCSETKRPVLAHAVGIHMDALLEDHGTQSAALRWKESPTVDVLRQTPRLRAPAPTDEIVYFLRAGEFIKIGKATGTPANRVAALRTGCPFPIEVMGTIAGGLECEIKLHRRFAHIRAHGEWFHAAPDLIAFIEKVTGGQQ